MIDFFVSKGASLVEDNPIAWGLINKRRYCLGLLKQHADKQPELMEQANIALRHHSDQGNSKWVALTLWAGADPWKRGPDNVPEWDDPGADEEPEDPYYRNAVELAVGGKHAEILQQKKLLTPPDASRPESLELLEHIWFLQDRAILKLLLERGHTPKLSKDRCSNRITWLLCAMSDDRLDPSHLGSTTRQNRDIDTYRAQEILEMVKLLLDAGALWLPEGVNEVARVRQSLMKMAAKYTFEFIKLLHDHRAGRRRDIEEVIRTQPMKNLLEKRRKWVTGLVETLPDQPDPTNAALT